MAPKEPYRESEWADVSPLLKYISGAVAPRLKAPKGLYQASFSKTPLPYRFLPISRFERRTVMINASLE